MTTVYRTTALSINTRCTVPDSSRFVNQVQQAVAKAYEKLSVIVFWGEQQCALFNEFVERVHDAHHVGDRARLSRELEEHGAVEALEERFQRRRVTWRRRNEG